MNPELPDKIDEVGRNLVKLEGTPSPFMAVLFALKAQMLMAEILALTSMAYGRSTAPGEGVDDGESRG